MNYSSLHYWLFFAYAAITHVMSLLLISATVNIILLRTILIFRGQWMADILDTEVVMISRKGIYYRLAHSTLPEKPRISNC